MPERSEADSAQVRAIADQLFATWKAEQERQMKENRRFFGNNIGSWSAALVLAVTGIGAAATTYDLAGDANDRSIKNETAIAEMRIANSDRLGRIETKIDIILKERGQ